MQIKKILELDQIFNKVLKVIMLEINDYLAHIFNDSLSIYYYLLYFKEFVNVILCKLRNIRDYINSKSYQLISLRNILGKIIKVVLVTKISYLINFLPKMQFKGRRKSYIEIIIYYLLEKIYTV